MTDLRVEDFEHDDPPAAEDAPPVDTDAASDTEEELVPHG